MRFNWPSLVLSRIPFGLIGLDKAASDMKGEGMCFFVCDAATVTCCKVMEPESGVHNRQAQPTTPSNSGDA